eukprot:3748818-Prorocentrum_lima.AAC.1
MEVTTLAAMRAAALAAPRRTGAEGGGIGPNAPPACAIETGVPLLGIGACGLGLALATLARGIGVATA